ncbi:autophagy-related protein [Lipomyces kononenkoae]|uniref:Autophagy-related protein n=1 Tax=Lipomyces kononenkoae TaxID=34357 RepID=A0ACC3SZ05_LIPKO
MLLITIDIILDRLLIRDVIKAVLSSIFFHRLFGSIRPLSPAREVLDITYPSVDDPALDSLIDEKLTHLTAALDTSSQYTANQPYSGSTQPQIVVNFFEKKTRKAWFSKSEEEVCWEEWTINILSITPRNETEKVRVAKSAESQLQTIIMKIIDIVNDNRDHIPPIATTEANPFPYQISIPSETEYTWGSVFKKILVE